MGQHGMTRCCRAGMLSLHASRGKASPTFPRRPLCSPCNRPSLRRPPTQQAELSDAALAAGDASLAAALQRSRRVGGLLLRHEEAELAAANQLADELVAREFAAPSRPHPCSQQADDCVRCYTDHPSDTLAFAAAVEAYGACAKAAVPQRRRPLRAAVRASGCPRLLPPCFPLYFFIPPPPPPPPPSLLVHVFLLPLQKRGDARYLARLLPLRLPLSSLFPCRSHASLPCSPLPAACCVFL